MNEIGRYGKIEKIGWHEQPKFKQELQEEYDEVKSSVNKNKKKLKTINTGLNKKSKIISPRGFLGW